MDEMIRDDVIWVEIVSGHHDVLARHRRGGSEIRIGRAYGNDVVVDDPYVAPHHLRIRRDAVGALIAEDLGSANGLFLERGRQRLERVVLDGDRPIRIGRTLLRIRAADHAVAAERRVEAGATPWRSLAGLGAVILGFEALATWLSETGEMRVSHYLMLLAAAPIVLTTWAAGWALLCRLFAGEARFARNLLIALAGAILFSVVTALTDYSAFALSWQGPAAVEYIVLWSLLAGVSFFHLRVLGPARLAFKGGILAVLVVLAVGLHTLRQSEARADADQPGTGRRLLPPTLRLVPLKSEDSFLAAIAGLKAGLDKASAPDEP